MKSSFAEVQDITWKFAQQQGWRFEDIILGTGYRIVGETNLRRLVEIRPTIEAGNWLINGVVLMTDGDKKKYKIESQPSTMSNLAETIQSIYEKIIRWDASYLDKEYHVR